MDEKAKKLAREQGKMIEKKQKMDDILDALHNKKHRIWYDEPCENGNGFLEQLHHCIKPAQSVTKGDELALNGGRKLSKTEPAEELKKRGNECAFRGCTGLERVGMPSSVKELGRGLLGGCVDVVSVYCDEGSTAQEYCLRHESCGARFTDKETA